MPELSQRDVDPGEMERIVGAHASVDLLAERYLSLSKGVSVGEFEVPLLITGDEALETLDAMQLGDLVTPPGDYLGVVEYDGGWLEEERAQYEAWRDQKTVIGSMALSYACAFDVSHRPTEISMLGYRRRAAPNEPASSMVALSLYYKRGRYDGQQIIGLHTSSTGKTQAVRFAHFDRDDEREYEESVRRLSSPLQTSLFVGRARGFLSYARALDK
jgi:hypothetical protein